MPLSKQERARLARETVNKTIPSLLSGDALARAGVARSVLLRDLPPLPKSGPSGLSIHVYHEDTLSAVQRIRSSGEDPGRIAILNMASPLRPGGGLMTGANSQEEYLCLRSTLYPALKDEFYRIPETGLIYTRDVLVFRDSEAKDLPKVDRYHVDVVTSAMLRLPDVVETSTGTTWAEERDKEMVLVKMRVLMRALVQNGVSTVVLGAWGCG